MKRKQSGVMQVEFICPGCGKHLAWAVPSAEMSCPQCGKWVNDDNRKKEHIIYLPVDSDQMALFC